MAQKKAVKKTSATPTGRKKKSANKPSSLGGVEPTVGLVEAVASELFNVLTTDLGDPSMLQALTKTVAMSVEAVPCRMPVRDSYGAEELRPKTLTLATKSLMSQPIQVPTISSSSIPQLFATSGGADTSRVADMSVLPYCAIGRIKVTARIRGSNQTIAWNGSGFVVGERTIYSAAHVLASPSKVSNAGEIADVLSVTFEPQFPNSTLRTWSARWIVVHKSYQTSPDGNLAFDMAAMVTDPNDTAIATVTGKLGWNSHVSLPTTAAGIGYPSDPPTQFGFDGKTMWQSVGKVRDDSGSSSSNFILRENHLTRGGSGGPWVVQEGGARGHRVIGLNSHVRGQVNRPPDFSQQISPIFDDDFLEVLRGVKEQEVKINPGIPETDPRYKRLL